MCKKMVLSLFVAIMASSSVIAQSYEQEVAFFKEKIKTLSSDEFGGRKPLTEYETKTIHYIMEVISSQLKRLQPIHVRKKIGFV